MPDAGRTAPDGLAVRLSDLGKAYRIFQSKLDNFADALGIDHLMPWYRPKVFEFWALRGINLELAKGRRIGIVGRNGAGKTTLLKLITGNLSPTTGTVRVNGKIQALIDAGTGFHPDFTGRENIKASLTLQGFSDRHIAESTEEIADFTELGEFLDRPFKTYSSGMAARLVFATATAIRPEVLVIDEILGAGDAYFLGKSNERMRQLVDSGASILLVSHSMEQITLICDQAIWLDRGRVVKSGSSLEVVKAYGQYVRILEDRRQLARNHKAATRRYLGHDLKESYSDTVVLRFVVPTGATLHISRVRLLREGSVEEECLVGDAQDSEPTLPAFVVLDGGQWSKPVGLEKPLHRTIGGRVGEDSVGQLAFNLFVLYPNLQYAIDVEYRLEARPAALEVSVAGTTLNRFELQPRGEFSTQRFELAGVASSERPPATSLPPPDEPVARAATLPTRWPGEGSLVIDSVKLLDSDGTERAVYERGAVMSLRVTIRAVRSGRFPLIPVAVLYRSDGVKVFSHIGEEVMLEVDPGATRTLALDLGELNLGDGHYAFALAIYRTLNVAGESTWYDLIDRDYQFEVVGAPVYMGLFEHGGRWTLS